MANPVDCRDVVREFDPTTVATPAMCQLNAQLEASRWIGEHPHYSVKRLGCRRARMAAKA